MNWKKYFWTRWILPVAGVFLLGWTLGACNLLEVNNPNNLVEEDLNNPAAAEAMANGVEATVTRAVGAIMAPYGTVSDELTWVGSRDAWGQLDLGNVDDPFNEFTDAAFPYVAEARWWADDVIKRLEQFQQEGKLRDRIQLARAYLYGAVIYITIADMFDDFAFSDRQEPGPPIGRDGIPALYDKAVNYLDNALPIAQAEGEASMQKAILTLRARAKYDKALRNKIYPGNVDTANPLVNDAGAVADAQAALALLGTEDFAFKLDFDPSAPDLINGAVSVGFQVNSRLELRFGNTYIEPTDDNKRVKRVSFQDIIDPVVHPFMEKTIEDFVAAERYMDITVSSAREMHLILAEAALASGDEAGFTTHINHLRAMDGLTPYSGQVPAIDMLKHARQTYLFLQGRRLADHYRFDVPSPEWQPVGTAVKKPGSFFPITITEIQANPLIGGSK